MTETVTTEAFEAERPRPAIRWDGRRHSYRPAPDWLDRVSPRLELHCDVDDELDPVTFEVIRNRLWTSNLAHGETLTRISGSPVFQALDFNMCFLTEDGEVVMNAPFIVYLDVGATLAVRFIMENFSEDPGIHEGDIFIASDPWIGASHQMDVLIAAPVFVDGKLFAWVSNAGHQYDMGGIVPGGWPQNAPDIYSDPVFFSPFKIVERGVLRKDLELMYRRQSRLPDLLTLDLRAQLSGCRFAAEEVQRMCTHFGAPTIKAAMRRIIDNAQASFSDKLRRIPDGRWTEVRWLDEKMPGDRHTYRVQVNIEKRGDRLLIDNHGTDPQQEGPVGFVYNNLIGGLLGMLSVTMLCEHLFALGGAERQIDLDPEPGLLSCVDYPAAVSGGVCSIVNYMNAVLMILGRMLACDPELKQDSLGAQTEFPLLVLAGLNDRGEYVGTGLFDGCGQGSAGKTGRDGVDTTGLAWSPLMRVLNAEDVEQVFPIMYLYRREQPDGGGAGKWRGGTGLEFAFTPYRAKTISAITNVGGSAVSTHGALGLFGGYPVPTSTFLVLKETDLLNRFAERDLPDDVRELRAGDQLRLRGKSNGTELLPGDVLEATFGGGAGYGDPIQRDPAAVAHDIQLGYVSRATAEEVYGVAFHADGDVDAEGTNARRSAILADRLRWPKAASLFANVRGDAFTPAVGEPDRSVHEYIVARDVGEQRCLVCTECAATLSDYRGNYKLGLLVHEGPVTLIPKVSDPTFFLDDPMVFRRYCCPGCGVLMTTELLRDGDEPVEEVVFA